MAHDLELDRRALLTSILSLVGAASSSGFSMQSLANIGPKDRRFFSASGFDLLSLLADAIIPGTKSPGALAANVPAKLDTLMLSWASANTQSMVTEALGRVETASDPVTGKSFRNLASDERVRFLSDYDAKALMPSIRSSELSEEKSRASSSSIADPGYQKIKQLIVMLYYVSEIGMTQERVYEHIPGKWVPSLEIMPGMRPFSSPGLL